MQFVMKGICDVIAFPILTIRRAAVLTAGWNCRRWTALIEPIQVIRMANDEQIDAHFFGLNCKSAMDGVELTKLIKALSNQVLNVSSLSTRMPKHVAVMDIWASTPLR